MVDCGDEVAAWLSRCVLNQESGLRLGFHDENLKRRIMNDRNINKYYPQLKTNDMVWRTFSYLNFSSSYLHSFVIGYIF